MAAAPKSAGNPAANSFLDAFGDVSAAVESGAGLPEVTRAAGRALNASVAVVDTSSSVLAVACASPEDERAVLAGREGSESLELRVADTIVGRLHFRSRGSEPPATLVRMVGTLIALDLERSRAPERASDAALSSFLGDVLNRRVTEPGDVVARAHELGVELADGATVIVVRAHPTHPEEGDWRARVLMLSERGARAVVRAALAAVVPIAIGTAGAAGGRPRDARGEEGELVLVLPGADAPTAAQAASSVRRELESGLAGHGFTVATSRPTGDPMDMHRAGREALLAANVADVQGRTELAFEDTGAYRLLLPAMSEDASELGSFYEETVAPLVAYDDQYETGLLRTLEAFLDADANVANTAQRLFTHRHTIRYRLERVRDLTGLDVGSSDGRERLSLGLKAMRVLGIASPHGPATEPGAEGGKVPREKGGR